ncbi:UvrD-helicase domain-containing protein [Haloarcula amylolytica]|uniref:UvrD-helicase domain-containing protein n=1 Tax=Haloarcula amylolytica TaxID=396317 RepID=UPI003C796A26
MSYLTNPDDAPSVFDDDPQSEVFNEYFDGSGRVVVGAGAGTGKTTTLIDIVAETVLQKLDTEAGNPMDDLLVTTFTKDAAGELKTELKQRLRLHESETGQELDPDIWRWIETDSYIETIDSFTHRLLGEVAVDAGISPDLDIRDGLEDEDLIDEIMEELRENPEHAERLNRLEDAYPNEDWRDFPPRDVRTMLADAHSKSREFCWTPEEMGEQILATHRESHANLEPEFSAEDIRDITEHITGQYAIIPGDLPEHASRVYEHNEGLLEDFKTLLVAFDELYDAKTLDSGELSHTDITYLVWRYLNQNPDSEWAQGLSERFDHVFIDEFQDTSFAQCRILSHCFPDADPTAPESPNALFIGDVKQSIYQWRSADPQIFSEIIQDAQAGQADEYLEVEGMEYRPLTTNFRSHPDLVESANHIFDAVFDDEARGDIGPFPIPFEAATAERASIEPEWAEMTDVNGEEALSRLHVLDLGSPQNKDDWWDIEAQQIARTVSAITGSDRVPVLDGEATESLDDPQYRQPEPGDITLLFNRRHVMPLYVQALRQYGVDCAVDVSAGLFDEPEVRLLVDVLDWFANPHQKDSLIRILRSPVTALEDRTIRYLVSENLYLSTALQDWPEDLPEADRDRLEGLLALRNDLRWDREKNKAELVSELIQHTAFDSIVLADPDGKQKFANLWLITEIAAEWEDEELMTYREFVIRLKRLRDRAQRGDEEYPVAKVSDENSDTTVRLTTVHQSKGMEYPIVILPDLQYSPVGGLFPWDNRMLLSRDGVGLRPDIGNEVPVDFDQGGSDYWLTDDYNPFVFAADGLGTTWLRGNRGDDGTMQDNHPLADNIAANIAEFWRTLYVAYTRASDHLIFGLTDTEPWPDEYMSWTPLLRERLQPDGLDGWREGVFRHQLDYAEANGSPEVCIGIDDLETGTPIEDEPIGMDVVNEAINEDRQHEIDPVAPDFFPEVVRPSSIQELLACPLRFQYSELEEISGIRAEIPPGSTPPGDLQRSQWGDLVHLFLERYHEDPADAEELAETYSSPIQTELLEQVQANFENSDLASHLDTNANEVLPEHEVLTYAPDLNTYVRGQIDLLYEDSDGWHIVDYKTGRVAEGEEYSEQMYRRQLAAYRWLVDKAYDIEIASTELFYIHPDIERHPVEITADEFEEALMAARETLEVISGQGLQAEPDPDPDQTDSPDVKTRCGSCPYRGLCPEWAD